MVSSPVDFVDAVVADRDLMVTRADDHVCRLEPRRSDLGRLVQGLGRFARRTSGSAADGRPEGPFVYLDPTGILDAALRQRIEHWPPAPHGDGVVRPAELSAIKHTREGLVVVSVSWWDSAPALDHQIGLALEIAHRLAAHR